MTLVLFVIIVVGGRFLLAAFGPGFEDAYIPLVILGAGQLVNALCGPVGLLLMMTGNERLTLAVLVGSVIVNLVLNVLLIPVWGLTGAAVSTGVSMALWNILLGMKVRCRLGIASTWVGACGLPGGLQPGAQQKSRPPKGAREPGFNLPHL